MPFLRCVLPALLLTGCGWYLGGDWPECEPDESRVPHLPYDGLEPVPPCESFEIQDVSPPRVHPEGSDEVVLRVSPGPREGCKETEVTVGGVPAPSKFEDGSISFVTPPRGEPWEEEVVLVELFCPNLRWGLNNRATADLVYAPDALLPEFPIHFYDPRGIRLDVDEVVRIAFLESIDETSLEGALYIEGVDGAVAWDEQTLTATFTPDAPLEKDKEYFAVLKAGEDGVRSALRERPFAKDFRWSFRT